uniref:Uncharacterized protein n=1 Tax=Anguilla anguilla TaxID=7936 RepID=A0A0E9WDZ0_ANGAN
MPDGMFIHKSKSFKAGSVIYAYSLMCLALHSLAWHSWSRMNSLPLGEEQPREESIIIYI